MLDSEKIYLLVGEVKKKKELQSLDDIFVREYLIRCLTGEPKLLKSLQQNFNPKSKAYAAVIKQVRSQLRRVYGLFRDDPKERKKLVQELLKISPSQRPQILNRILATHSSTQERMSFYNALYSKLFSL